MLSSRNRVRVDAAGNVVLDNGIVGLAKRGSRRAEHARGLVGGSRTLRTFGRDWAVSRTPARMIAAFILLSGLAPAPHIEAGAFACTVVASLTGSSNSDLDGYSLERQGGRSTYRRSAATLGRRRGHRAGVRPARCLVRHTSHTARAVGGGPRPCGRRSTWYRRPEPVWIPSDVEDADPTTRGATRGSPNVSVERSWFRIHGARHPSQVHGQLPHVSWSVQRWVTVVP